MLDTNYLLLLPTNKFDKPDHRFEQSLDRIRKELGEEAISELIDFASQSQQLQKTYATQGLNLALAVFHEAAYLDRNHRFDKDNEWGYKSKVLRKQAQVILERLGFSRSNAHKLVKTASWMVTTHQGKDELKWFESLTPSHLYELSRMSAEAYKAVKDEVTYEGWHFCTGQKSISVRRLEQIRRLYQKLEVVDIVSDASIACQDDGSCPEIQQENCVDSEHRMNMSVNSNTERIRQFVDLAQSIDWDAVGKCSESIKILDSLPKVINFAA